jgi:hypothetical protein
LQGHDSGGACRWQHMAALDEACQISVENQIFALLSDDLLLHLSSICRSSLLLNKAIIPIFQEVQNLEKIYFAGKKMEFISCLL